MSSSTVLLMSVGQLGHCVYVLGANGVQKGGRGLVGEHGPRPLYSSGPAAASVQARNPPSLTALWMVGLELFQQRGGTSMVRENLGHGYDSLLAYTLFYTWYIFHPRRYPLAFLTQHQSSASHDPPSPIYYLFSPAAAARHEDLSIYSTSQADEIHLYIYCNPPSSRGSRRGPLWPRITTRIEIPSS